MGKSTMNVQARTKAIGLWMIMSLMIVATALLMSGCGGEPENELVDKWECINVEQSTSNLNGGRLVTDVTSEANDSSTMTVKNGGDIKIKIRSNYHNEDIKGTWEYVNEEGESPYLKVTYDDEKTIKVEEDQYENCYIKLPDGEMFTYTYTFWRKK